jgi:hypothetical protein
MATQGAHQIVCRELLTLLLLAVLFVLLCGALLCSTSACDASGEVWDVAGLYIADGSAFPTTSGVNPMITIFGVSHLTAQGIASRWKQQRCA